MPWGRKRNARDGALISREAQQFGKQNRHGELSLQRGSVRSVCLADATNRTGERRTLFRVQRLLCRSVFETVDSARICVFLEKG